MKTLLASLIALGLTASVASAQSCSPYGHGHRPTVAKVKVVEQPVDVAPPAPPAAPVAPVEPPAPAPVPQK